MYKIIFAGTTEFGIPTLEKLSAKGGDSFEICLIVTQPDKPAGRKHEITPPPIKVWAQKHNIPFIQPDKILNCKLEILNYNPDLILVAAYGQIIPKEILDIPKFKSINIHGSLLPKFRGASPIQSAILKGEKSTGITLIQMDEKMDHGPIIAKNGIPLTGAETYPELYKQLSVIASELVAETLPGWFENTIKPVEQDHAMVSFCKMVSRDDAKIDWTNSAIEISRKIRALNPEPGTWSNLDGKSVKIIQAKILNETKIELPGRVYNHLGVAAVKCGESSLLLEEVQPEGKTKMSGKDFLNGLKNLSSKIFTN